jgi:hypothetical protein
MDKGLVEDETFVPMEFAYPPGADQLVWDLDGFPVCVVCGGELLSINGYACACGMDVSGAPRVMKSYSFDEFGLHDGLPSRPFPHQDELKTHSWTKSLMLTPPVSTTTTTRKSLDQLYEEKRPHPTNGVAALFAELETCLPSSPIAPLGASYAEFITELENKSYPRSPNDIDTSVPTVPNVDLNLFTRSAGVGDFVNGALRFTLQTHTRWNCMGRFY